MHMIDVHASEGTFPDKHRFAQGACGPTYRSTGNEPRAARFRSSCQLSGHDH